jgi:hypothetical protein
MGSTILQTLPKITDGLLLFESFEVQSFPTDQGWTLLNGTPQISSDVAKEGLKSLKLDTSYPELEKTFTAFKYSAGWFYDDAAAVAGGFTPFMRWITSTPATFGLGVDLATSVGFYSKVVAGVTSATAVARSTGWHRFEIVDNSTAGTRVLKIDGTTVSSTGFVGTLVKVRVGVSVYAGAPAFGYFDWIQVAVSTDITVNGLSNSQLVQIYTSAGALVASSPAAGPSAILDVSSQDSPFDGYIKISRPGGTIPYFRSAVFSMSAGDDYSLCVYDFGRRPSGFDVREASARDDKESNTGVNQSTYFFSRDIVSMTFMDLTEEQKEALYSWWQLAKRGEVFSAALDNGATYAGELTANVAYGSAAATLDSVAGVAKGQALSFKSSSGNRREIKKVASVAGLVATMESAFCADFQDGDQVRDQFYWPYAIATDKTLQLGLSNLKKKRWTATIVFKEALF